MTAQVDPLKVDKSRRRYFAVVFWMLGSPTRAAGDDGRPPMPAAMAEGGDGVARPMIKPSTHQKVAIDAHRDDRP